MCFVFVDWLNEWIQAVDYYRAMAKILPDASPRAKKVAKREELKRKENAAKLSASVSKSIPLW